MKAWNRKAGLLLLAALFFTDCVQARAEEKARIQGYSCWENQNMDVRLEPLAPSGVKAVIDGSGAKEDYGYSVVIGTLSKEQAANGLRIHLKARASAPVHITFQLQDVSGNTAKLKENALAVLQGKKTVEVLAQGQLTIEEDFHETLAIPFDSFEAEQDFAWDRIINFSIGITQKKGSVLTLQLKDPVWYDVQETVLEASDRAAISGETELELPVHGEAIARYTLDNPAYRFRGFEREGIRFDASGQLTVTTQAAEEEIVLEAENAKGMRISQKVKIVPALRNTVNYISAFPAPEEMKEISVFMERANREDVIAGIRITGISSVVIILAAFCYFHRKRKGERGK